MVESTEPEEGVKITLNVESTAETEAEAGAVGHLMLVALGADALLAALMETHAAVLPIDLIKSVTSHIETATASALQAGLVTEREVAETRGAMFASFSKTVAKGGWNRG